MKPTDFAVHLTRFLSEYLPGQKNVSRNTISSYRDTFKLLIRYCQEKEGIAAECITMNTLSGSLITRFLEWLETERKCSNEYPLFANKQHKKLTKEGVSYIISKYVEQARQSSTLIPAKVRPHMFRHSKAMHLLQAGVNLIYIRDFLGHTDIKVTEVYARADTETKRKAIENAYPELVNSSLPDWNEDQALLTWLSEL
jgi:site-specific recombinase XerD